MLGFSVNRLAMVLGLAVASAGASVGAAQALLNDGANFDATIPVTAVVTVGVCSAQSVATGNNVNHGRTFERNDAKSHSDSDSDCKVANDILRNVEDALNENFVNNNNRNFSDNANDNGNDNLNDNIRDIGENGALIQL
jgi:hypothetical protein